MEILPVSKEDAPRLCEIYSPYVLNTPISFEYVPPTAAEFESRIETYSKKYPYIKAVENGIIYGYAYASPFKARPAYSRSVELSIYLSEDSRGKGLGRALYNKTEEILGKMGILNMNACITCPPGEESASVLFHKKMGFELVGRFHNAGFKFGNWYDIVWMEKIIGEHTKTPKEVEFSTWRRFV